MVRVLRASRSARSRIAGPSATILVLALVATMAAATSAPAATPCTTPPQTIPVSQLTPGTIGSGVTALAGTTPTPFDFRVLGTIPNGWRIGLDAIVIQITGPQSFLDETNGVFFGMSGSPAYVGGRLAGAVSGVFTDPAFGVLTPAGAMVDLLDAGASAAGSAPPLARTIPLTDGIRRAIARASGVSATLVSGSFEQLPLPLGVSGVSESGIAGLQARLDERGANFRVYAAGSTPAGSGPVLPIAFQPGQPLGVAVSTGDASYSATGTATFMCGDSVVAFGHPFFSDAPGPISLGLSGAEGLMILKQPGYPGSRFALLTEARGQIVQDRFAGIVGAVGTTPPSVPITSQLTSPDSGISRFGATEAIHTWGWWIEEITWAHLSGNFAAVFGHYGSGSSELEWTIEGTTESGVPFTVSNRTMASDEFDAAQTIWSLVSVIDALQFNRFEDVTFTGIATNGSITRDRLEGDISRIRVSSPLQPSLKERAVVKAEPGDVITVEVTLDQDGSDADVVTTFTVKIPRSARGSSEIRIGAGRGPDYSGRYSSFDELVAALNGGDHPNDLVVKGFHIVQTLEQSLIVHGRGGFRVQVVR